MEEQVSFRFLIKLSLTKLCSLNSDTIQMIKNSYWEQKEDFNIVAVDWGQMAISSINTQRRKERRHGHQSHDRQA